MARMSPSEAAAKWREKASAATGDYASGIERTQVDPGQAAAAASAKWLANVQQSQSKFAERVRAVSKGEWQRAAIEKGAPRYGTGVQQAEGKMAAFASEFFPHLDAVTQRVKGMPSTTLDQRIERARQQMLGTSQFRRRGGGGGGVR